jgi:predicted transcriptional regulator
MRAPAPQHRVLAALRDRARTWDDLKAATRLNDDQLGQTLGKLLNDRLIWTAQQGEGRVYGLEKRTGLVPRGLHQRRRATD